MHIPRRPYVESLPGIPTIRVFEALACGIPLISAPWSDSEALFRPEQDFWLAEGRRRDDRAAARCAERSRPRRKAARGPVSDHQGPPHLPPRVDDLLAILAPRHHGVREALAGATPTPRR